MSGLLRQYVEQTLSAGPASNEPIHPYPFPHHESDELRRAIKAACAPGRYDPQAPEALQSLASTRTAPIAAAPLSSPAHPAPLAQTSDYDLGADQARRSPASFSSPFAAQPLAASPAPPAPGAIAATSWLNDYDKGLAHFRELLGKTATTPRSSPAHPAPPAPDAIAATS